MRTHIAIFKYNVFNKYISIIYFQKYKNKKPNPFTRKSISIILYRKIIIFTRAQDKYNDINSGWDPQLKMTMLRFKDEPFQTPIFIIV